MGRSILSALACVLVACAHSAIDRNWVSHALRAHHVTLSSRGPSQVAELASHALSEDDAVAFALALSPSYRADLARLQSARADFDEARRPTNPQLTLLAALGPVSAMATLLAPLDSLWQVPMRTRFAARTLESVAASLVQSGLDLARDVRLSHIARGLAERRVGLRRELAQLLARASALASERVKLGEASPAEAASLRAEAALALDAQQVSESDALIARSELRVLLGLDASAPGFDIVFTRAQSAPPPVQALTQLARQARPDVRAAELSLLAAGARAGWERSRVFVLAAQLEGHWTRPDTLAARLGGRVELPIFGANPGGIGRARAEIERASAALLALRQRVVADVQRAHVRAAQAQASLARYRGEVLPALEEARKAALAAYQLGEDTYLPVLLVLRSLAEARLREAELSADVRRAQAELERAVGARIGASS